MTFLETSSINETIELAINGLMDRHSTIREEDFMRNDYILSESTIECDPAPNLNSVKPIFLKVGHVEFLEPSWREILHSMLLQINEKGLDLDDLARELLIPSMIGRSSSPCYWFSPELNFSVQNSRTLLN
jgi:hypothetical protein